MVVGAGPVPARWPHRATFGVKNHAYIAPRGPSGWHRACPYFGKKTLDMGYITFFFDRTTLKYKKFINSIYNYYYKIKDSEAEFRINANNHVVRKKKFFSIYTTYTFLKTPLFTSVSRVYIAV